MITNDVSDYINIFVRIAHIICNLSVYQSVQRLATGWMIGVSFPNVDGNFSLPHHVQTGSGAHPAS
jgi:hypothetical protein